MARQSTTTRTTRRQPGRSSRIPQRRTKRPSTRSPSSRARSAKSAKSQPSASGLYRKATASEKATIQRFLEEFSRSLTAGDGRSAAQAFEYPSLMVMSAVGDYSGTHPMASLEEAARFFDQAPEQYHAKGIEETFPDVQDVQWIAHDLALARVHFPYVDADGNDLGDGETSVYVIRKTGDHDHVICAAITLGTDSDRAAL